MFRFGVFNGLLRTSMRIFSTEWLEFGRWVTLIRPGRRHVQSGAVHSGEQWALTEEFRAMGAMWNRFARTLATGALIAATSTGALILGASTGASAGASNLTVAGQTEPPRDRKLVAPPPGFSESCTRYSWLCEHGATGALDPAKLIDTAERINRQVNRAVSEMTDIENYGSADRWTLPVNGRGDCEDFVLEKYRLMLAAGADSRDLSVAVVLDRHGDNHAVLVLRHVNGDLILDNLEQGIRPWNQTRYRFLAMQASDDKRLWQVVMHQPRDRLVLAER